MAIIQTAHGAINQYMGARYVPKLMDEWAENIKYDYLNQVNYFGDAYISKKPVPLGTPPTDAEYWMRFPYGARLDEAFAQIVAANKRIDKNKTDIADLRTDLNAELGDVRNQITAVDNKATAIDNKYDGITNTINTNLTSLTQRVVRNEKGISDNAADIMINRNNIANNKTEIDKLKTDTADLSSLRATVQRHNESIQTLNNDMSNANSEISDLKDTSSNLLSRVGANETSIINLRAEVSSFDSRVESLEDTAQDHGRRISQLEQGEEIVEKTQPNINIVYPPESSHLPGMKLNSMDNQSAIFKNLATWASTNNYGLYVPSGSFNIDGLTFNKQLNITGNGVNSILSGAIDMQGEVGKPSFINDITFNQNIVTLGSDINITNCVFRNGTLRIKDSKQIQSSQCNFYKTNDNVDGACIKFEGTNENIRFNQAQLLSERGIGIGVYMADDSNNKEVSFNGIIAGPETGMVINNSQTLILNASNIYNVDKALFIHASTVLVNSSKLNTVKGSAFCVSVGGSSVTTLDNCELNGYAAMLKTSEGATLIVSNSSIAQVEASGAGISKQGNSNLMVSNSRILIPSDSTNMALSGYTMFSNTMFLSIPWNAIVRVGEAQCQMYGCVLFTQFSLPTGNPEWIRVV